MRLTTVGAAEGLETGFKNDHAMKLQTKALVGKDLRIEQEIHAREQADIEGPSAPKGIQNSERSVHRRQTFVEYGYVG